MVRLRQTETRFPPCRIHRLNVPSMSVFWNSKLGQERVKGFTRSKNLKPNIGKEGPGMRSGRPRRGEGSRSPLAYGDKTRSGS
jgi:hypothetical protein